MRALWGDRKKKTSAVPRSKSSAPEKRHRIKPSLLPPPLKTSIGSPGRSFSLFMSVHAPVQLLSSVRPITDPSLDPQAEGDHERVKRPELSRFMPPKSEFPQSFHQFVPPCPMEMLPDINNWRDW